MDSHDYQEQKTQIRDILRGSEVTYKYVLLTSAVSKAVNPNIHYRVLQKRSKLQGAYDARSVAHRVVVPFEKSHGERLGGSNEPYLNKPARFPELDPSNATRNLSTLKRVTDLLQYCQVESDRDKRFPLKFLRQVLKEMRALPSTRKEFHVPPVAVSLEKTVQMVDDFLAVSGSGERLVAICAASFSTIYDMKSPRLKVVAYPVNWSDKFARTAGDIEFRVDGKVVKAAESKDKPITESDVRHCMKKAKEHGLTEYLLLSGAGIIFEDREAIDKFIHSVLKEGINIYILDVPQSLSSDFVNMGEDGRKHFLRKVGEFLNRINATHDNKNAWQLILDKYLKAGAS